MSNIIEIKVPDIGDFKNIPVIEVFVKPGDTVKAEDSLMTLDQTCNSSRMTTVSSSGVLPTATMP